MGRVAVIDEEDLRQIVAEETRRALEESAPAAPRPETPPEAAGRTVRGLDPHALYSRRTLADRWDCSQDTVRRHHEARGLRQTEWAGGSPRYRGADILRYEGVPETELVAATPAPLPIIAARRSSNRPGRPPKAGSLPQL